jgi:hypothetical protein
MKAVESTKSIEYYGADSAEGRESCVAFHFLLSLACWTSISSGFLNATKLNQPTAALKDLHIIERMHDPLHLLDGNHKFTRLDNQGAARNHCLALKRTKHPS